MKINPLGNRVLARKLEEKEGKTAGGIVLPESAKIRKVVYAQIIEVGPDKEIAVRKGDEIIVSCFSGTEIEVDEDKLLLVKAADILAVIEG